MRCPDCRHFIWEWDEKLGGKAEELVADTWRCRACEKLEKRRAIMRKTAGTKDGMKVHLFRENREEAPEHWLIDRS